jgi:molybdate transport system substrate-binding protein
MHPLSRRTLVAAIVATVATAPAAEDVPTFAAASDLRYALDEIAANFQKKTGRAVRIAYGSSGNFFQQITRAAPFELFFSADEDYIHRLASQGLALDQGALYAVGRLVLFLPKDSPIQAARLADLAAPLAAGRIRRFAIANPQHAPYGRAAAPCNPRGCGRRWRPGWSTARTCRRPR